MTYNKQSLIYCNLLNEIIAADNIIDTTINNEYIVVMKKQHG